jgi:hypothetical protein
MRVRASYCAYPSLTAKLSLPLLFLAASLGLVFVLLDSGVYAISILGALIAFVFVYWSWSGFLHKRNRKQGEVRLNGTLLQYPVDEVDLAWERSVIVQSGPPGTMVSMRGLMPDPDRIVFFANYPQQAFETLYPLAGFVRPLDDDFDPGTALTLDASNSAHVPFIEAVIKTLWEQREKSPYYRLFASLPWPEPKQPDGAGPVSVELEPGAVKPASSLLVQAATSRPGATRDDPAAWIGALLGAPLIEIDEVLFLSKDYLIISVEEGKTRRYTAVPLATPGLLARRDLYTYRSGGSGVGAGGSSNECIRFNVDFMHPPGQAQHLEALFPGRDRRIAALGAPLDAFDDKLDAAIAYINGYR